MNHLQELELAEWRKTPGFRAQLVEALYQKARAKKTSYLFIPLADAYAASGEIENAVAVLRGGLSKHPGSRAGRVLLAQLLYDQGEEEEARHILEEIVPKWPDNPASVTLLAKMVAREGDFARAASLTDRLVAWYPDSTFIVKTAKHYARLLEENSPSAPKPVVPAPTPPEPKVSEPKVSEPKVSEPKLPVETKPVIRPVPPRVAKPTPPPPPLILTPTMVDTDPHDHDDDEAEVVGDPLDQSTVFLPEPEPEEDTVLPQEQAPSPKSEPVRRPRRPSKKKAPEGQMALFRLESMLDSISRLKGELEKD